MKLKALSVLFVLIGFGCGSKDDGSNPSIKADFQEKVNFTSAAYKSTINFGGKPTDADCDLLKKSLRELRGLIPASALTLKQEADLSDLVAKTAFSLALKVEKIELWVFSKGGGDYLRSVAMSVGVLDVTVAPAPDHGTYRLSDTFDYKLNLPQYSVVLNAVIPPPKRVDSARVEPYVLRERITYSTFHPPTVAAIESWRAKIDAILADVEDVRTHGEMNYPFGYKLQSQLDNLQRAYNELP